MTITIFMAHLSTGDQLAVLSASSTRYFLHTNYDACAEKSVRMCAIIIGEGENLSLSQPPTIQCWTMGGDYADIGPELKYAVVVRRLTVSRYGEPGGFIWSL